MKVPEDVLRDWPWPYLRTNMGGAREYVCPCGVGHGGIHGCCGNRCCGHPGFGKRRRSKLGASREKKPRQR